MAAAGEDPLVFKADALRKAALGIAQRERALNQFGAAPLVNAL